MILYFINPQLGWVVGQDGVYKYSSPSPVEENSSEEKFSLFPNPASDVLRIELSEIGTPSVEIFSGTGEKISLDYSFEKNFLSADVSGLAVGVYYLKISSGKNSFSKIFSKL